MSGFNKIHKLRVMYTFNHTSGYNVFARVMFNRVDYEICDENPNSAKSVDLLQDIVSRVLDNLPLKMARKCFYQFEGAPPHSLGQVHQELTTSFGSLWIGFKS